jgi:hypothetical protein
VEFEAITFFKLLSRLGAYRKEFSLAIRPGHGEVLGCLLEVGSDNLRDLARLALRVYDAAKIESGRHQGSADRPHSKKLPQQLGIKSHCFHLKAVSTQQSALSFLLPCLSIKDFSMQSRILGFEPGVSDPYCDDGSRKTIWKEIWIPRPAKTPGFGISAKADC